MPRLQPCILSAMGQMRSAMDEPSLPAQAEMACQQQAKHGRGRQGVAHAF
jgi:hypothetical protein